MWKWAKRFAFIAASLVAVGVSLVVVVLLSLFIDGNDPQQNGALLAIGFFFLLPLFLLTFVFLDRGPRRRKIYECRKCGYDLRGNTTEFCPECGKKLLRGQLKQIHNKYPV
ncbi:MAG: hypothetical protein AAGH88_05740 [Planctomycetota bacterium]